ncbi:MAG: hypothetical protein GF317_05380 [Candidatus Lokiarchaeota archaeon]|nr:hypothetical protein [Candidatus Lokiarchaeota archaeon]MBD3199239.1 hypothetical protein [Candidatus Lokiarchaeota archaeon]
MLNRLKSELLNIGLKFITVDEKIVRLFLETSPKNVEEIVILPAVKLVMKKVVNKLENKQRHGKVYNGLLNGVKVSVIRTFVGCPNMAIIMECLKRSGVKIAIRIDFCGGIKNENKPIDIGDVTVPVSAFSGDGTNLSYLFTNKTVIERMEFIDNPLRRSFLNDYLPSKIMVSKPDERILEEIVKIDKSTFKHNLREVKLWTIDGLFCENTEFLNSLKKEGIEAVDMETSSLYFLGNLYNIQTISILAISDLPGTKYDLLKSNEIHPEIENGINRALKILLQSLPSISKAK